MLDINARLGTLEAGLPALNEALASVVAVGLERINQALLPAFNQITQIQELGFNSAPIAPATNVVFTLGGQVILISQTQAEFFVPAPWVVLVREANATDYCIAQVNSYNSTSGALNLTITSQSGNSGTYSDVIVEGCPGGALAAISARGDILSAQITIAANLATINAALAIVEADTTYIEGIAAAGPVTSVNGITGAVTGVEVTTHKNAPSGYAGLGSTSQVAAAQLPIGLANGVCGLDGTAKVSTTNLPASVNNCMQYQGTWNAATNVPALASGAGTQGQAYKVSAFGTTVLDGNTYWNIGDFAVFNGTTWDKFFGPNNNDLSITNSQVGNWTLQASDIGGIVEYNTTSSFNVTIPPDSSLAAPVGTKIIVINHGTGAISIVKGTGVSLLNAVTSPSTSSSQPLTLYKKATNSWGAYK